MIDFFERLDNFMIFKGLNDNKMTIETGISNGLIGKARKKGGGISLENISKILNTYSELNAEWLITGKGEMLKNNEQNITQNGNNNTNNGHNISGKVKKIEQKIEQTNAELLEIIREKDRQIASLHKIIEKLSN
ncbi:hypothetical protein ACILDT_11260 [Capnocytophaga canis]|uniref:hypothetical protein n=1 Tax=Capnocytophaga canis TaxID=1848903 RepID=UPI0037D68326